MQLHALIFLYMYVDSLFVHKNDCARPADFAPFWRLSQDERQINSDLVFQYHCFIYGAVAPVVNV